jgi:hypothetical protein
MTLKADAAQHVDLFRQKQPVDDNRAFCAPGRKRVKAGHANGCSIDGRRNALCHQRLLLVEAARTGTDERADRVARHR